MEEKAIKDFDRCIENMMNEHVSAPPFGAWNRIAAELEAVPAPVAVTSAPAQQWISSGTVLGFISGALMIATLVGSWVLYNEYSINDRLSAEQPQPIVAPAKTSSVPVAAKEQLGMGKYTEAKNVVATASLSRQVEKAEFTTVKLNTNREDVAAPTVKLPMDKQVNSEEPYYFPPVDINVPTSTTEGARQEILEQEVKPVSEPIKEVELKKATSSSSSARIKFKKKRNSGWNYGKINRTKSRSKY